MSNRNWKIPGPSWASFIITVLLFVCVVIPIAIFFVVADLIFKLTVVLIDVLNPKGKQ